MVEMKHVDLGHHVTMRHKVPSELELPIGSWIPSDSPGHKYKEIMIHIGDFSGGQKATEHLQSAKRTTLSTQNSILSENILQK